MKKSKKITALMAALSVFGLTGCDLGSISDSIKNFDVWNLVDPLHWFHDKKDKDQDQDKDDDKDVAVTSVVVTPSTLSLKEGASRLLSVEVLPSNATNKTVTWTSTNPEVATVSNGNVVAVKEGTATIKATADGKVGQCVVTVTKDGEDIPPVPVEITEIISVNGPAQLEQGSVVNKADFTLTVKYSDGTTHTANPDRIELSTAVVGDAIQGTAYINQLSKTFTIKIVAKEVPPVTETITPQKAIELMDAAGEGVVVAGLQKVKGICAANTKYDTQYKQYTTGFEGVDNFKIQFTDTNNILNGGSPDGMEIVVEGYLEKYNGKYQLSYLPATSSPTGEKFTPNLVSATAAVHEGVLDSITVSAAHREFYKGSTFVEETVTAHYSDGATATVKATFSGYDMNTLGEQTVTVSYTEKGVTKQTTYTINVIERGSGHAGTLEDPLTTAEAVTIANGLAETTDSKNPIASEGLYVKGVVTEFKETFSADYGNYSMVIGGDFTLWRIKNGPEFAKFNTGDIEVGDEVTAFVYIMNFKGTPESTSSSYVYSVQKAGDTKTLQSIEIVGSLTKTSYVEGQTYSSAGLSVKGHYDDGSEKTVAATITLDKQTAQLGDTEIIASASFEGKVATAVKFAVTVTEKVPVTEGAVYTFTNSDGKALNMGDWTTADFMPHVVVDGAEIITGLKSATFAYIGGNGGSGDSTWNIWDCLKVGKSQAKGEAVLELDSAASFTKIKVLAIGARDDGTLTINGITKNVTKKAVKGDLEPMELEYDITGGFSELTISSKDAASNNYGICITRLEFVGGKPTPQKELQSISIEGDLAKTAYVEGEAYSKEGLSVKGHYSDNTEATVQAEITLDKATATLGDTSVKASATFEGKNAEKSFDVTVSQKKTVTGITFSNEHRTFDQYAEFVPETVTATFTVGEPEVVTAQFSTPNMSVTGEQEILVSYTDEFGTVVSDSYTITVVAAPEPELVNITIEGALAKNEYKVGEAYSAEGLSVVAHYDNNANQTVDVTITLDKQVAQLGDTSLKATASFEDKNTEKDLTIQVTKVEENVIDVSSVDSYSITAEGLGLDSYASGENENFKWTDLAKHANGSIQGNHSTGDKPKDSELHNVRAFSKNITYIKVNVGYAAGAAATGELRFGNAAQPEGNAVKYGAESSYDITAVGSFIIGSPANCPFFSLKWTKGAAYFASIEVHFDEYKEVAVTGVTLNKTSTTIEESKTETLIATVAPADAFNKEVTWTTSNQSIATVDATGKVTGISAGSAVITATTKDGAKTATCNVTVTASSGGQTTSIPLDLKGSSTVVFNGVSYANAIKAGTGSVAGSTTISVPAGAKKLTIYAAGWNKESVKLSVTGTGLSTSTLTLTPDAGVSGNGPTYTVGATTEASFKFEIDVSTLSGGSLTLTATSGKRFVVWNASYTK